MGGVFGGGVSTPKVQPLPPEPAPPPEQQDAAVIKARDDERRRAAQAGRGTTILTGSQGLTAPANSAKKSLLGV